MSAPSLLRSRPYFFLLALLLFALNLVVLHHVRANYIYPQPVGTLNVYASLVFDTFAARDCQSIENESQFPNNSISQASASPQICTGQNFIGKHDQAGDREDIYRMVVGDNALVNISLDVPDIDLSLRLYDDDANTTEIDSSTNSGSQDESIEVALTPGTYFVRVYRPDNNVSQENYVLTILTSTCGTDREPNNFYLEADNNLPLCQGSTVNGSVSATNDVNDIYRMEVEGSGGTIQIALTNLPAGADYDLYLDAGPGNNLAFSTNAGSANEMITFAVAPGRYYIRVYARVYGNPNGYQLRWTLQ